MHRALPALAMLLGTVSLAEAQVAVHGRLGFLDRRLAESGVVERQSGLVGGGGLTLSLSRVRVTVVGIGGKLSAKTAATPDVDYARLDADVSVLVVPWLAVTGGLKTSVYVSSAGAQRWILPRVGAELRVPFNHLSAHAYIAGSALVGASTNSVTAPGTSMQLRTGVRGGPRRFQFFAEYELQRLNFATGRQEQSGALWVGVGVSF